MRVLNPISPSFTINSILHILVLSLLIGLTQSGHAQGIAISDDSTASADASAMLDVSVTATAKKGILIPRMTAAQRQLITAATGLLVYQTDAPVGFFYYDGSQWNHLGGSNLAGSGAAKAITYWSSTGNSLQSVGTFVYDSSNGRIGLGTSAPEFGMTLDGDGGIMAKGTFGSGASLSTVGQGTRLFWYPRKAALRAGFTNAISWTESNIGDYSVAMGNSPIASGEGSVALGWGASATGKYSAAIGNFNEAKGYESVAIGSFAVADAYASFATGMYNVGGGNTANWIASDPLFEIGNGQTPSTRSNAFTVLKNGKVGIGTATPTATLHMEGDEGLLVSGTYGQGSAVTPGAGERLHYYPYKGAFRAGSVAGTQWDDTNVGAYSVAMGRSTQASAASSTALGFMTTASGQYSVAAGNQTTASGESSTALGQQTTAIGKNSTAMGWMTTANALNSTALGYWNVGGGSPTNASSTDPLFEIGNGTSSVPSNALTVLKNGKVGIGTATPTSTLHLEGYDGLLATGSYGTGSLLSPGAGTRMHWYPFKAAFRAGSVSGTQWDYSNIGAYSVAMGNSTKASGDASTALGEETVASGDNSTAMGWKTNANSIYSVALGFNNVGGGDPDTWVSTDPLFEIGNGTGSGTNNALTVLKNGNVGIGFASPTVPLDVQGQINASLIKLSGGSPGAGKVLTSDANGLASWEPPASFSGTLDQAYDFGGAGAGRVITADSGPLHIDGVDGFLATGGTTTQGSIPATGAGPRMMWYPKKRAFRAGLVDGTQWDDSSIGWASFASGKNTTASGDRSTAMGNGTTASGAEATAMGNGTTASGANSTALGKISIASGSESFAAGDWARASGISSFAGGYQTEASATASVALGYQSTASGYRGIALGTSCTASGNGSVAIGNYVSSNGHTGSVLLGDGSTTTVMNAAANNRFYARFDGGYRLWTDGGYANGAGVQLLANGHSWSQISDSTKKENFKHVDGEFVLSRFKAFRLGSWNYIGQDPAQYRHYGPMAQEWFSAFGHDGIGAIGNDTLLTTGDVEGILCIAVQALEKRTSELQATREKVTELESRMQAMEASQRRLLRVIERLGRRENAEGRHASFTADDNR